MKHVKINKKLLFVPEDTSEESLDSNDDSYDRKMEERKKKKRKKEILWILLRIKRFEEIKMASATIIVPY